MTASSAEVSDEKMDLYIGRTGSLGGFQNMCSMSACIVYVRIRFYPWERHNMVVVIGRHVSIVRHEFHDLF